MTTRYKTRAFVFKKTDVNESDRIFSVFTYEFGRLDIYAKAIRKISSKLKNGIDIFSLSEIEFIQGKNRKTLTDALKSNKSINDLEKLEVACRVSDVLDSFIKGQEKDKQTFDFLSDFFCKLSDSKNKIKNYQLVFQYFFWNFISLQGYGLQTKKCANCFGELNPNEIYFSAKEGGVVCKNCQAVDGDVKRINSDVVKLLRLILLKDWITLLKLKISPISQKLLQEASECARLNFCPS